MDILEFLDLGEKNTAAIKGAGGLIGAFSTIMSFGPAAAAVNQVAGALGLWDQETDEVKDRLTDIDTKLDQLFAFLGTGDRLNDENERRRDIKEILEHIRGAVADARHYGQYPDDPVQRLQFGRALSESRDSLNVLQSDEYFTSIYDGQLVYVSWNGPLEPPGSRGRGDTVWSYKFILPAVLEGMLARLLVIAVAYAHWEPARGLYEDYQDEVDTHAKRLIDIHNKIQDAIKAIPRPPLTSFERTAYLAGSSEIDHRFNILIDYNGEWADHDRPYGAVECYSVVAKEEHHRPLPFPQPPTNTTVVRSDDLPRRDAWGAVSEPVPPGPSNDEVQRYREQCQKVYDEFALRHTLRTYRKQMEVYREVGLPIVWDSILDLKRMAAGPSPMASNYLAGWSVRDITRKLSPWSHVDPDEPISIRQMATLFDDSPPVSLLKMLKV